MPLFEYTCRNCGGEFEALVGRHETPSCPACESAELDKKFSVFAKPVASTSPMPEYAGSCGTCGSPDGPGSCALD